MRTTLDIDDDLMEIARQLAAQRGTSMGKVISDLTRRALEPKKRVSKMRNGVPVFVPKAGAKKPSLALVKSAPGRGMKPFLLDVNVLVALFDPAHPNHEAAHAWFAHSRERGWATCPITINGCVRVLSNPAYPTVEASPAEVISRLRTMCDDSSHVFWMEEISLLDDRMFHPPFLSGHQKITDAYLLALAVVRGGRLATFDRSLPMKAVRGAEPGHLALLGGD